MLKLSDFFQPFNLFTILCLIGLCLFFDILGTSVKGLFIKNAKINNETRLVNWLIGVSFFVFLWFLVGFVIEANRVNLLISMFILLLFTLPGYLKRKEYQSLSKFVKPLSIPILLMLPILPLTLIKASLPPYYNDELNYHFISPHQVMHQLKMFWTFEGGTLMNVPRFIDNFYILTFSLTHTYSVVRLLQFLVLLTSLFYSFLLIKKLFGKMSAFLFLLIFLGLPLNLPLNATIGYVDVPAYSFMLLGLLLGIAFILKEYKEYLILSIIFWGMSIGTKYTSLMTFAIFLAVFGVVYWFKNKSLKILFDKGLLLKLFFGLTFFGGYWYIKNFVIYGNPIYPFIFHCWGKYNTSYCPLGSSFFSTWTTPVNLRTLYPIINQLLPGNIFLHIVLAISSVMIFLFGNKKIKKILLMIILVFGMEMMILKYFSGFFLRYQQHLAFTLILAIVLIASVKFRNRFVRIAQYSMIALVVISCSLSYYDNIQNTISGLHERNYFFGKMSIYDWVNHELPKLSGIISWCEKQPIGTSLTSFDLDSEAVYIRPFLMNCYFSEPDLNPSEWKNFTRTAIDKKLKFWTISYSECNPQNVSVPERGIGPGENKDTDAQALMRKMNNVIVCNSEKILPNFYYFDYRKLNKL